MTSKIRTLEIRMYNLDFFDYYSKLELRSKTKLKIQINFEKHYSSFQEAIDSLEILSTNFTKFDEIKEFSYRIYLETEFKDEILNKI